MTDGTPVGTAVAKQPRSGDPVDTLFPPTITVVATGSTPVVPLGLSVSRESRR
ncbi:hypothetical protein [Salinigranum sp. GCM10025319]|uniref:hypothetical protein n=1 Tax=Salinigranum sp. GCM10025319 TaxID=3252687 RepID=UPI003612C9CE